MPKVPLNIYEDNEALEFLKKRQLEKQYIRACHKLLSANFSGLDWKERQPTGSGVRTFRINRQFRAVGGWKESCFVVSYIDNHQ